MPEHRIRLRAAWTCRFPEDSLAEPVRVDLPVDWTAGPSRPFCLERGFQTPRLDPALECLSLHLDHVAGLTEVRLNGLTLDRPGIERGPAALEISLPSSLPQRNLLVLEVDPTTWSVGGEPTHWGEISLVIRGT